jgi:molybdenum cofactor biosynthesis enzyme MoaA
MSPENKPYVQTYTIVAGSLACNSKCPYCVAKMTPHQGVELKETEVNWRNFDLGARLTLQWGAATALITSKGEATLFPHQITQFMYRLKEHKFPLVELQTNGILLAEDSFDSHLKDWYELGMSVIAVSMAHYDSEKNNKIFQPDNKKILDLESLIDKLHKSKFSVRLTCIMLKDYIDNIQEVYNLINFAKNNNVEQLTVTPVNRPKESENKEVAEWVNTHLVPQESRENIKSFLDKKSTKLRELVHGAVVYDYKGQNICLNNCLTIDPTDTAIRQVIFFPDGHVRYDWQHKGAILF